MAAPENYECDNQQTSKDSSRLTGIGSGAIQIIAEDITECEISAGIESGTQSIEG